MLANGEKSKNRHFGWPVVFYENADKFDHLIEPSGIILSKKKAPSLPIALVKVDIVFL